MQLVVKIRTLKVFWKCAQKYPNNWGLLANRTDTHDIKFISTITPENKSDFIATTYLDRE